MPEFPKPHTVRLPSSIEEMASSGAYECWGYRRGREVHFVRSRGAGGPTWYCVAWTMEQEISAFIELR